MIFGLALSLIGAVGLSESPIVSGGNSSRYFNTEELEKIISHSRDFLDSEMVNNTFSIRLIEKPEKSELTFQYEKGKYKLFLSQSLRGDESQFVFQRVGTGFFGDKKDDDAPSPSCIRDEIINSLIKNQGFIMTGPVKYHNNFEDYSFVNGEMSRISALYDEKGCLLQLTIDHSLPKFQL